MTYIYNDIMSVTTTGNYATINFRNSGGVFLRNIEFTPTVGVSIVESDGDFSNPTITLGGVESLRLDFANKRVDRFDSNDSVTLLFTKPVQPGSAHLAGFPDGYSIKINPCAVPEPGSVLIGSIGLFLLLKRRRK